MNYFNNKSFKLSIWYNQLAVNDEACGANEVYNDCGSQCPPTCADIAGNQKPCNHMCVFGCFCVDGHVRQHDANSPCIKQAEC